MLTKIIVGDINHWIDLSQVESILSEENKLTSVIYMRSGSVIPIPSVDVESIVQGINGAAAPKPVDDEHWRLTTRTPPTSVPAGEAAVITRIERDQFYSKTSGEYRAMWRCTTDRGMTFNIFDHADPARNTLELFKDAGHGHGELLEGMAMYEYLTFRNPNSLGIPVTLQRDGEFWKPVTVGHIVAVPDPDESAADDDDDD